MAVLCKQGQHHSQLGVLSQVLLVGDAKLDLQQVGYIRRQQRGGHQAISPVRATSARDIWGRKAERSGGCSRYLVLVESLLRFRRQRIVGHPAEKMGLSQAFAGPGSRVGRTRARGRLLSSADAGSKRHPARSSRALRPPGPSSTVAARQTSSSTLWIARLQRRGIPPWTTPLFCCPGWPRQLQSVGSVCWRFRPRGRQGSRPTMQCECERRG